MPNLVPMRKLASRDIVRENAPALRGTLLEMPQELAGIRAAPLVGLFALAITIALCFRADFEMALKHSQLIRSPQLRMRGNQSAVTID